MLPPPWSPRGSPRCVSRSSRYVVAPARTRPRGCADCRRILPDFGQDL
ncbi:hypothetical protein KPATCC21470_7314 [Kitasatospora purpeofusca]